MASSNNRSSFPIGSFRQPTIVIQPDRHRMWTNTMMTSVKTRKNVLIKSAIACSLLLLFVWMLLPAHTTLNPNIGLGKR